ncbi:DUF5362 family protein [Flavobacteriaceae bacterium S356]|uniref:DUF5362 family protein n=1 Tax=Asprobacillus argus TaxID=3076534 RepID=A0ABU3LEJ5_9FLAO|nr:DUF5362 family protein [Flavobacteriaceae bacterium S356]
MAIDDIGSDTPKGLTLNNQTLAFLREIAKWTNFLAIVGFIGIGLVVLMALFGGAFLASAASEFGGGTEAVGGAFFTIIYLLVALLYFFPVYYLFKFSRNMKASLQSKDESALTKAFEYMKSHYKFVGILTIIMLSFYALIFLFGLLGFAASGF